MMWDLAMRGHFTMERVVESMCHAPALRFGVHERGFLREGYAADLVLLEEAPSSGCQRFGIRLWLVSFGRRNILAFGPRGMGQRSNGLFGSGMGLQKRGEALVVQSIGPAPLCF